MSLMFTMNKGKAFLVYKFIWTFLFQILFIIIECSFHFVVFFPSKCGTNSTQPSSTSWKIFFRYKKSNILGSKMKKKKKKEYFHDPENAFMVDVWKTKLF